VISKDDGAEDLGGEAAIVDTVDAESVGLCVRGEFMLTGLLE
jgi:hypothetical protein